MFRKVTAKAIITIMMLMLLVMAFGTPSEAATFSVSAASTSLTVGGTTTLSINGTECIGQFTISSSDSSIVSVGSSTMWIEETTSTVTLTAKKAGKATITVTATNVSDSSGNNDVTGSKSVTITVTESQSSSSSSDATLKSITVGGTKYSSPSTDFTVKVSSSTSSITIAAETNNSNAKVSGTGTKDLVTGTNKITLTVTAESGATKTYTIRVTRLAEESTTSNLEDENPPEEIDDEGEAVEELRLSSLTIEGVQLIPEFSSDVFEYTVYITDLEELSINAVANMEEANVEITGNTNLLEGENVAVIRLTKDDQVVEYKITINKTILAESEEEVEEKTSIIGIISDWWNRAGPATLTFTIILILLGAAIIFAIVSYKYSKETKKVYKHGDVGFIQNEDLINDKD